MEAAGTTPRVGPDLSDLAEVIDGSGPFLTLYLLTDGEVDNAGSRSEQRWKTLRRQLAGDGAPESALALVDPLVGDAHLSGAMLSVVADASRVLLVEHLDDPLDQDRCCWGRLPDLAPLIRWRQSQLPYVLALADHGGADLIAERPGRSNLERTAGDGDPQRKVSPGGWSQQRYQQRADNDWANTAADVAGQVAQLSEAVDARIIILGGDGRATHMIRDDLGPELAQRTHIIDQGRAADGSEEARIQEVRRLVASAVAEDTVALIEKFKEERGQHDRAAEGAEATIDALNRVAVDVLLVHDDRQGTAWVGEQAVPIGMDDAPSGTAEGERADEATLTDALVRAAIGTGASVRIIPDAGPVQDGIGALLRWSNPTT